MVLVLMFAGGEDDYDEPDTCQKPLLRLRKKHEPCFQYIPATHGWDIQERARVFRELGSSVEARSA
jgi:hypothetical protein